MSDRVTTARSQVPRERIVAIHQPNFFPWLGFFDKLRRCDAFVVLDHVQFPKTGGIWTNRVKLSLGGEARWFTAPIDRNYHGVRSIADMHWQANAPWREKLHKSLAANYARAPYFRATMEWLEPLIHHDTPLVGAYNSRAIVEIARQLGIDDRKLVWSSTLNVSGHSSDLLVALTRTVGGTTYRAGGGADGYQDDAAFAAAGIGLSPQTFVHPVYSQGSGRVFAPGLSIIDALMHVGADGVRAMLEQPTTASRIDSEVAA